MPLLDDCRLQSTIRDSNASLRKKCKFCFDNTVRLRRLPNQLWRVLYPACKTAGVPRVSWHELRHTHATLLNSQGESMKTIQAQLRHSSSHVTMEIYTHAIPQHQRDAVE